MKYLKHFEDYEQKYIYKKVIELFNYGDEDDDEYDPTKKYSKIIPILNINQAINLLKDENVTISDIPDNFVNDIEYITEYDQNFNTGNDERCEFTLNNFTEEEEYDVWAKLKNIDISYKDYILTKKAKKFKII